MRPKYVPHIIDEASFQMLVRNGKCYMSPPFPGQTVFIGSNHNTLKVLAEGKKWLKASFSSFYGQMEGWMREYNVTFT